MEELFFISVLMLKQMTILCFVQGFSADIYSMSGVSYSCLNRNSSIVFFRFPNESAVRLLLACGSRWLDLDAVEYSHRDTPLHLLCMNSNNREILELLLKSGCHIDCVNKDGLTPFDYIADPELKTLDSFKKNPSKLKCLCAHRVVKEQLNIDWLRSSKSTLNKFVFLHGYRLDENV